MKIRLSMIAAGALGLASMGISQDSKPETKSIPKTRVVIAIAEPGYHTEKTLPELALKIWTADQGYHTEIIIGDPTGHNLPRLADALKQADILVLSIRRQALPTEQLQAIRDHLSAGKSLLAIRTSSHGLTAVGKGPKGNPEWPDFDREILGAAYEKHDGHQLIAEFTAAKGAENHPILKDVELPLRSGGGFYFSSPLAETATPLLMGKLDGMEPEPVAWTNQAGKSRVFYTCLGQEEEFALPGFQKLLENAMNWLRPVPQN